MKNILFFIFIVIFSHCVYGEKPIPEDILARYPGQDDYISPTIYLEAVGGHKAHLPCNITSPIKSDPPILVLWYRKGVAKPIYSYDLRGPSPKHHKNEKHFGSRGTFDASKGELIITRVTKEDENEYRCRVDFKENPTLTYSVNLTVIIPPKRLWIVTEDGIEANSKVGPYAIGDRVLLTCKVSGGRPPPNVIWTEGRFLLDDVIERTRPQTVANTLMIERVGRNDLNRVITCVAKNSKLVAPLQQTVTIDMIFPPLDLKLLTKGDALSEGKRYKIECEAVGSRPIANIEFTLGGKTMLTHSIRSSAGGNLTIATLLYTPEVSDTGKELVCKASSTATKKVLHDSTKIVVHYKPRVHLQPGHSLDLTNIEEGADVYFECLITADPPTTKVEWLLNEKVLKHNVSIGVIISNQSLVLQRVEKLASGEYACRATNTEGHKISESVLLRVKYSPACKTSQVLFHGAARLEQVHIPCQLDAHPMPSSYTWTFNNSGESVKIPEDHVKVDGFKSTVSYTPMTELDYGTLLCWGTNIVGKQRKPCVFHVFPAGRPDPVHNCSQFNLSDSAVNIRCSPGFDGGLPQTFFLELYDNHSSRLVSNVSSESPILSVSSLSAATSFAAVIYSTNEKGSGELFRLQTYTLKDNAEKRTAAIKPAPSHNGQGDAGLSPMIIVACGVLGGLFLVVVVISIVVRLRLTKLQRERDKHRANMASATSQDTVNTPTSIAPILLKEPGGHQQERHHHHHHSFEAEDINPDDTISHGGSQIWKNSHVRTISSSSMVGSYVTLPRRATGGGCYSQQVPQTGGLGSIVPYSELSLTRAPSLHGNCIRYGPDRDSAAVMYTAVDSRRFSQPLIIPPPPPEFACTQQGGMLGTEEGGISGCGGGGGPSSPLNTSSFDPQNNSSNCRSPCSSTNNATATSTNTRNNARTEWQIRADKSTLLSSSGRWLNDLEESFHCGQKRFNSRDDDDDMKKSLLHGQHESSV